MKAFSLREQEILEERISKNSDLTKHSQKLKRKHVLDGFFDQFHSLSGHSLMLSCFCVVVRQQELARSQAASSSGGRFCLCS